MTHTISALRLCYIFETKSSESVYIYRAILEWHAYGTQQTTMSKYSFTSKYCFCLDFLFYVISYDNNTPHRASDPRSSSDKKDHLKKPRNSYVVHYIGYEVTEASLYNLFELRNTTRCPSERIAGFWSIPIAVGHNLTGSSPKAGVGIYSSLLEDRYLLEKSTITYRYVPSYGH